MQVVLLGPAAFWTFAGMATAERMVEAVTGSTAGADVVACAINKAYAQTLERQFRFEERKRKLTARGGPSSYASFEEYLRHA